MRTSMDDHDIPINPIVDDFFDDVLDEVDEQYESPSPTESDEIFPSRIKSVDHINSVFKFSFAFTSNVLTDYQL